MKKDKFLIGILIGIAVLIVVVLAVFFTRRGNLEYLQDDTPENITQNYILALQKADYEKAYSYLADLDDKPTFEEFRQPFLTNQMEDPTVSSIKVIDATHKGKEAVVRLTVMQFGGGPFGSLYEHEDSAILTDQDGEWKISYMPYPYWYWDWYNPGAKTIP